MTNLVVRTHVDDLVDMEELCEHVANGRTVAMYCRDRGLSFREVTRWIKESKVRQQQYAEAKLMQEDWGVQMVYEIIAGMLAFDHKSYLDANGNVLPLHKWPPEARAALMSYETATSEGVTKPKFESRRSAAETIGKMLGAFQEKAPVQVQTNLMDLVKTSLKSWREERKLGTHDTTRPVGGDHREDPDTDGHPGSEE